MKQISTPTDIKKLGSILSVWAHPDDETFSCGGIIATAIANGQKVTCITMTKGEAGSQDPERWPLETLGEVRAKELHRALSILGCEHHAIHSYPDGGLSLVDFSEGVELIAGYIKQVQPESILTFGPDGMTGHSDHQTVSAWVNQAVNNSNISPRVFHAVELREDYETHMKHLDKKFNIYFNIDEPPLAVKDDCTIYFELPPNICALKCEALAAMPSQTEKLIEYLGDNAKEVFKREAFVLAD